VNDGWLGSFGDDAGILAERAVTTSSPQGEGRKERKKESE